MEYGRLLYNFHLKVAEVILDHGIIFGGYVRDTIIHNHFAQLFYDSEQDTSASELNVLYKDPNYKPETNLRLLLPQDIDCYMTSTAFEKLVTKLSKHPDMKVKRRVDLVAPNKYIMNRHGIPLGLMLSRMEIGLSHNPMYAEYIPDEMRSMKVYLDILHAPDLERKEPPFGCMDFECNCLVMDKGFNLRLSAPFSAFHFMACLPINKHNKLQQVIDDITQLKAIPVVLADFDRACKLAMKGWCIQEDTAKLYKNKSNEEDEHEICPICCDHINVDQLELKNNCCNSRYHPSCFGKYANTLSHALSELSCPTCRTRINIANLKTNMWPSNQSPP